MYIFIYITLTHTYAFNKFVNVYIFYIFGFILPLLCLCITISEWQLCGLRTCKIYYLPHFLPAAFTCSIIVLFMSLYVDSVRPSYWCTEWLEFFFFFWGHTSFYCYDYFGNFRFYFGTFALFANLNILWTCKRNCLHFWILIDTIFKYNNKIY